MIPALQTEPSNRIAEHREEEKLPARQFIDRMKVLPDGTLHFPLAHDSPTLRVYHEQVIRKNFLVYGHDRERTVREENGSLSVPPEDIERWKIFAPPDGDLSGGKRVLKRVRSLRENIEDLLTLDPMTATEAQFTRLFHSLTAHAAHLLDQIAAGVADWNLERMVGSLEKLGPPPKGHALE